MKPNIFISYSRREVGFVDDLAHRLEKEGFNIWLDYRSLVPGTPWAEQINKGIDSADVVLLVVSRDAIASKYVAEEWERMFSEKKRIVLAIFEAVNLPKVLEKFEWVDFRGSYEKGVKELVTLLQNPVQDEPPAPETGFKVPGIVWWAFFLSLATAVMSLFSIWSLFVPFFLIPLPYRIFKRDFNITQVQAALWLLPVVLLLTSFASQGASDPSGNLTGPSATAFVLSLLSILVAPILVFVLRSKAMRRWGKPQASLMKFSGLYNPEESRPTPVSFFIDYAPQDARIADEMARAFKKYGHTPAADIPSAQTVFVLLSEFKNSTEADPEKQTVFPVMIQTCLPADKLSKVQWIDFRGGVRRLDAMARLLPHPSKLLTALGVRPTGNQLTLPPIILSTYYFLILLGIFVFGSVLKNGYEAMDNLLAVLPQALVVLTLMGLLLFGTARALVKRKGWLAGFWNFSFALLGVGILAFVQSFLPAFVLSDSTSYYSGNNGNIAEIYPIVGYISGIVILTVFMLFRFRDVRLWFPAKVAKVKAK